jgi:hypothetical protein
MLDEYEAKVYSRVRSALISDQLIRELLAYRRSEKPVPLLSADRST